MIPARVKVQRTAPIEGDRTAHLIHPWEVVRPFTDPQLHVRWSFHKTHEDALQAAVRFVEAVAA